MSELGDTYRAWDKQKKEKKESKLEQSIKLLDEHDIDYIKKSDYHLRLANYDFWPSTGLFISRYAAKKRGRGVMNLINKVKKEEENKV